MKSNQGEQLHRTDLEHYNGVKAMNKSKNSLEKCKPSKLFFD